MHQQRELIGEIRLRSRRIKETSFILCQGLDSKLRFAVTLVFRSSIKVLLMSAGDRGRSVYDVA